MAALNDEPANLEALSRLLFALEMLGMTADAAQAWLCLGIVLEERARIPEAINAYQQVLARQSTCLDARVRLGALHLLVGEANQAVRHLESAVAIAPDHVASHVKLGQAKHLIGKIDEGWNEFVWLAPRERIETWQMSENPMWDGSSLAGQTVLLWASPDFGLGDTLQFARWAHLLKARGAHRVVVECQQPLIPLVARMAGVERAVIRGRASLPAFDVHVPMVLVPVLDRAARQPSAIEVPYLSAEPAHIEFWREQLGRFDGITVGLCWGAQSNLPDARFRSAPLSSFMPLFRLGNVRFVSLQLGPQGDQAVGPHVKRVLTSSASVAHTAALIQVLDLVITVDTMIAHLAGALGQPVWTLLPYGADWRWGSANTTAWYPTMRLFRQREVDAWTEVMERVHEELQARCVSPGRVP